jgi:hypothetical protein
MYASDNNGACGQSQTPWEKMSTGTGTLYFTAHGKGKKKILKLSEIKLADILN